jgi:hypothetical protein
MIAIAFFMLYDTSEIMESLVMYQGWFCWDFFEIFFGLGT